MQPIQFFAARAEDGALLPDASVDVFVHGTRERAPLFSDSPATIPLENPVRADANARVFFYTTAARIDIQIGRYGYVAPLLVDISTLDAATAVEYVRAEINKAINDAAVTLVRMREEFAEFILSSGYEFVGDYDADGPLTLTRLNQIFRKDGEFWRARPTLGLPYTTLGNWFIDQPKFVPSGDAALRQALRAPDGARSLVGGSLFMGEAMSPGNSAPGTEVTRGYVHAYYPERAGAIRVGGSDLDMLNDERGYARGLPSLIAWDPVNIGLYSTAFNRNSAAYGTYSNGWGHDCTAYGTASGAGGAGSATGNPDLPNDPFAGYCSFTWGKNNLVSGQKTASFGEENIVNTRAAMGFGYGNILQPSAATPEPVGSTATGRSNNVTGQGHALGSNNNVADGIVVGDHVSGLPDEVTIGFQSSAIRTEKPDVPGGRGKVGINATRDLEHEVNVELGNGKTLGITIDGSGSSKISLQGLMLDGTSQSIVDFVWSNPNTGSPLGELSVRMNGRSTVAFGLLANGTPIFQELKDAAGISGAPSGAIYKDAGVIKVVP